MTVQSPPPQKQFAPGVCILPDNVVHAIVASCRHRSENRRRAPLTPNAPSSACNFARPVMASPGSDVREVTSWFHSIPPVWILDAKPGFPTGVELIGLPKTLGK